MFRSLGIVLCVAAALAGRESVAQQIYRRADVDSTDQLRIVLSDGRTIRPPKDSDQVAFGQVAISPDRRTVGWVALFRNSDTTYPIPLTLVLLTAGAERTVVSNGLPIWQWSFLADGRKVAIRQSPVHGAAPDHYELRDIQTGSLVSSFDADSAHAGDIPAWARTLAHQ